MTVGFNTFIESQGLTQPNNFLRFLRKHGVTAYRLHKSSGLGKSTINGWTSGKHKPTKRSAQRIVAALRLPSDALKEIETRESWEHGYPANHNQKFRKKPRPEQTLLVRCTTCNSLIRKAA